MKTLLLSTIAILSVVFTNGQSVTAQHNNTKINLTWDSNTATTVNHFVIERSYDGNTFTDIATVFAFEKDAVKFPYQFADKNFFSNKSVVYYRVRHLDVDGKLGYYNTTSIKLDNKLSR